MACRIVRGRACATRPWIGAVLLVPLALVAGGCQMFRAEVGYGAGLGADVKLPGIVHTGLGVGEFQHAGIHYGRDSEMEREAMANLILWHWEGNLSEPITPHHGCVGIFPPLTTYTRSEGDRDEYSLEFGVMLGVFDIRLGFNPAGGYGRRDPKDSERGRSGPPPAE